MKITKDTEFRFIYGVDGLDDEMCGYPYTMSVYVDGVFIYEEYTEFDCSEYQERAFIIAVCKCLGVSQYDLNIKYGEIEC